MTHEFSEKQLIEFLDYTAKKGLVNGTTASARKAAVRALLDIADANERSDVRVIDIDHLANRFANLRGSDFTPASLNTYKSRFTSARTDFLEYRKNPLGFKPTGVSRARRSPDKAKKIEPTLQAPGTSGPQSLSSISGGAVIIPIPIRPDAIVQIAGLPADLTKAEANKVAKVILAFAVDEPEG